MTIAISVETLADGRTVIDVAEANRHQTIILTPAALDTLRKTLTAGKPRRQWRQRGNRKLKPDDGGFLT